MGQYLDKIAKREKDGMIDRVSINTNKEETMHGKERSEGEGSEEKYAHDQNDLNDIVIEPALKPNGEPVSPVYWESVDGQLHGPCVVTQVAQVNGRFWLIVEDQGQVVWVHESRLRSKQRANGISGSDRAVVRHDA